MQVPNSIDSTLKISTDYTCTVFIIYSTICSYSNAGAKIQFLLQGKRAECQEKNWQDFYSASSKTKTTMRVVRHIDGGEQTSVILNDVASKKICISPRGMV
jgi:hypothetical protein